MKRAASKASNANLGSLLKKDTDNSDPKQRRHSTNLSEATYTANQNVKITPTPEAT